MSEVPAELLSLPKWENITNPIPSHQANQHQSLPPLFQALGEGVRERAHCPREGCAQMCPTPGEGDALPGDWASWLGVGTPALVQRAAQSSWLSGHPPPRPPQVPREEEGEEEEEERPERKERGQGSRRLGGGAQECPGRCLMQEAPRTPSSRRRQVGPKERPFLVRLRGARSPVSSIPATPGRTLSRRFGERRLRVSRGGGHHFYPATQTGNLRPVPKGLSQPQP